MKLITESLKRIVLTIIIISILITFFATPAAYAKLDLQDGDYYYSGTTEGTYVPSGSIFGWLINNIGNIADYLLGILTLIIRMPFIGWTALLEKMLTWAIESTTGLSTEGDIVVSSTDYTGLTDSSRNITVESIVYNRVPALSIDLFELELDKTMSATGQKLVCKYCEMEIGVDPISGTTYPIYHEKPVTECIKETDPAKINLKDKTEDYCLDNCACFGCDACEQYLIALKKTQDPLIIRLRQFVATWYSIIRLLAMAAMLVVLIGIGIKMALSTIASDKAVFKRMLVDWVVGVIIIFVLHYFMYMVIYINNVMVDVIADSAQSINEVQLSRLPEGAITLTDSELELKIYEEVRTRAYDAKLSNGLIGTIMYMTLVYFAFKYTIIYVKRLLTIIVLTLMAPGVGVAYALQKALTGKSQALKTWMTEYIMNVIIQIVHALIYAIFISQALIMSLQNVSGMILALILMNYTSKAGTLFKKVFNFGGGDSLLGHTENANQSFKEGINAATGIAMGAAPVAKAMAKTPAGYLTKMAGVAAVAAGGKIGGWARNKLEEYAYSDDEEEEETSQNEQAPETPQDGGGNDGGAGDGGGTPTEQPKDENALPPLDDENIMATGGEQLRLDLAQAEEKVRLEGANPSKASLDNLLNAKRRHNRFHELKMPTNATIAAAHVERLVSMENVFATQKPDSVWGKFALASFGKTYKSDERWFGIGPRKAIRDRKTGKKMRAPSFYDQLTSSELLGLTDKDKKLLKEFGSDAIKGLSGIASVFLGMATIVDNPGVGFGLLAAGVKGTSAAFGRDPDLSRRSGVYTFNRYGTGSIDTIKNSALAQAQREHDAILAKELSLTHPDLLKQLQLGEASAVTIGTATGIAGIAGGVGLAAIPAAAMTGAVAGTTMFMATRLTRNTKLAGKLADIDRHCREQTIKQMKEFEAEAITEKEKIIEAEAIYRHEQEDKRELDRKINESLVAAGIINGAVVREDGTIGVTVTENDTKVSQDEMVETVAETGKKITTADVNAVDKEIDRLILEFTASSTLDITSKKVQADILKRLSLHFESTGLLAEGQNISSIFKEGEAGLLKTIKNKAAVRNKSMEEATQALEAQIEAAGTAKVQDAVTEMLQPDKDGKVRSITEITVDDVMKRLVPTTDGSRRQDSRRDGSSRVSENDGTPKTPADKKKYEAAVRSFLGAMQQNTASGVVVRGLTDSEQETVKAQKQGISKEEMDKKKAKVASERKSRSEVFKDVLEAFVGAEDQEAANGLIQQLLDQRGQDAELVLAQGTRQEKKVKIEARFVESLLADHRTIERQIALNEEKMRTSYDVPSDATKSYATESAKRSSLAISVLEMEKSLAGLNAILPPEDQRTDTQRAQVNEVTAELNKTRTQLQDVSRTISRVGPEVDVSAYIASDLYKSGGKDARGKALDRAIKNEVLSDEPGKRKRRVIQPKNNG